MSTVKNPSINIRGFRALNLGFFIRKSSVEHWCEQEIWPFIPLVNQRGFPGFSRKLCFSEPSQGYRFLSFAQQTYRCI